MRDPLTPRRGGRGSRGQHVHNYRCEDVMEYAVDVFAWKKSLEMFYLPGDWTRYYNLLLGYFFLSYSRVQTDITVNMRAALLAWLVGISRVMELSLETW